MNDKKKKAHPEEVSIDEYTKRVSGQATNEMEEMLNKHTNQVMTKVSFARPYVLEAMKEWGDKQRKEGFEEGRDKALELAVEATYNIPYVLTSNDTVVGAIEQLKQHTDLQP